MIYFTFNDSPSGIYKSQVIDVVKYLNDISEKKVNLIAMISLRNFFFNRKKIKTWCPDAYVYPMFPKLSNWKFNQYIIKYFIKDFRKKPIIARGPTACYLALKVNKNVCYDGRGAVKAELIEFPDMISDKSIRDSIINAEKISVLESKFKIAVSEKLVEYWRDIYNYTGNNHVVIPCTLSNDFIKNPDFPKPSEDAINLVFSGGTGGWQAMQKLTSLLDELIIKQNIKVVFLAKSNEHINFLKEKHSDFVSQKWVNHDKVLEELMKADYGILYRNECITNKVSSPVKFAEYLASGLKILISSEIGDLSKLVENENLGIIIKDSVLKLQKSTKKDKEMLRNYALQNFTKNAYKERYEELIYNLNENRTTYKQNFL